MKTKPTKLSLTLRKAAEQSGLSTNALAVMAGIPQPTLHRFLKDGTGLQIGNVDKLCAALGLELTPTKQPPTTGKEK